jgi:hypothetical protein
MRLISIKLWWIKLCMKIILKHPDNCYSQFYHPLSEQSDYNNRLYSIVPIPNRIYVLMDHKTLYSWGKSQRYLLDNRLGGTQIPSGPCGEEKNIWLYR